MEDVFQWSRKGKYVVEWGRIQGINAPQASAGSEPAVGWENSAGGMIIGHGAQYAMAYYAVY